MKTKFQINFKKRKKPKVFSWNSLSSVITLEKLCAQAYEFVISFKHQCWWLRRTGLYEWLCPQCLPLRGILIALDFIYDLRFLVNEVTSLKQTNKWKTPFLSYIKMIVYENSLYSPSECTAQIAIYTHIYDCFVFDVFGTDNWVLKSIFSDSTRLFGQKHASLRDVFYRFISIFYVDILILRYFSDFFLSISKTIK